MEPLSNGRRKTRLTLRNRLIAIALFPPAILPLALLGACSQKKAQAIIEEGVPVAVATAVEKTVPIEVRTIGTGEAFSTVTVKAQIEGQLEKVLFTEGQYVQKGDSLFSIDPRPFEAELRQAEANLARDIAQEKNAKAQADRYQKLFADGIVSKEQYDQFRTNADALDAAVRADRAAEENARIRLEYCSVRSPIAGRTGSLMVHEGNVVKANETVLVIINQIRPIYVTFSVPEQYLPDIKKFMSAGRLPVEALLPGAEQDPAKGTLTFVDNTVDSATGTIKLKATFTNVDRRLWPGQFVNVALRLSERPNAVAVPSQAVQTGQSGSYLFIVKPDGTVDSRPVVPGSTYGGETVIEKGLEAGETVVTDGQLRLIPGAKVEIKKQ